MGDGKDVIQKEDLFLLLESYKNSVEMNTVISQQLRTIHEVLNACKDETSALETNLKELIEKAIDAAEKARDKIDSHNVESIKDIGQIDRSVGKLTNKIYLLYIGVGSIVLSLFWVIYQLIDKYELLVSIAKQLGV
jgi:predicted PurR-regulated permease PerM